METLGKDVVSLLQFLLPGFISAWIFYAFTSYPKPSQFERIIQALIFTVIIQALHYLIKFLLLTAGRIYAVGNWDEASRSIWSVLCAILVGFLFSYFANNDKFHSVVRNLKMTRETSYSSEWYGAFLKNITYIVLHLKDERRLYGWPIEWPSQSGNGHFLLTQTSWLNDEGKEEEATGVEYILVDARRVMWVEFMKKTWEVKNE